ncbi:MAG TPA: ATP-binding protein [Kofleriaceae bacterium]|nr:ATP-binding protein [Kofleriaceae bacterium]
MAFADEAGAALADDPTADPAADPAADPSAGPRAADASTVEFRPGGLAEAMDALDDAFWLANASRTTIHYVSPAAERVLGLTPAEVYLDAGAWLALIDPEDRVRVEAVLAALPHHGYDLEYRIRRRGDVAWIRERAVPIRDADGQVRKVAGVVEDATRRRLIEDQVRLAQKQEAVGQLAGGIAHDFNNLLAVVLMQAAVLAETVREPKLREGVDEIIAAAKRASALTRSLQALSRRQPAQPVLLDLGQAIAGKTQLLRRSCGADITLETRFEPGLPMIYADPGMLEQVLMNLVANACEAMPGGGHLVISVRAVDVDLERAALQPGAGAGRHVGLSIADTGVGIAPEALPRIFEPFFTTKDAGTGTGLGLSMALGLVQQHRGWIEVDTQIGRGTTVTVLLPAADPAEVELRSAAPRVPVRGGHETILLVEDEAAVRTATRTVLQRYGYRVLEADSAAAALARWDAEGGGIDLLLTDLVMGGGISGRQLAETLRARGPTLKVIYMSGYNRDFLSRVLHLEPGRLVIPKPCTSAQLAATVRRCLDSRLDGEKT